MEFWSKRTGAFVGLLDVELDGRSDGLADEVIGAAVGLTASRIPGQQCSDWTIGYENPRVTG